MNHIDKVYYINLDHRTDRLLEIEKVLDDLGCSSEKRERIAAFTHPQFGTLGCTKSHMYALEKFIESGLETCLILEDDFLYESVERFNESIGEVFDAKVDFDIIQLSYNHNGLQSTETSHKFLRKVIKSGTISGILVHKSFAPKLLANYKEGHELLLDYVQKHRSLIHELIIDVYWQRLQPQTNWYCFSPRLGYQRESYSDIENKVVNYGV
jgi:GR25 family glycosyltransferase involved in LPS biosynthesis